MTDAPTHPPAADDHAALIEALGQADADALAVWFHPYANIFPLMPAEEQDGIGRSMVDLGQLDEVVLLDGLVLDGRNRVIQWRKRGCPFALRTRAYDPERDGPNPIDFVWAKNAERRQLTPSQRAAAAVESATMRQGARTDLASAATALAAPQPSANLPEVAADASDVAAEDQAPPASVAAPQAEPVAPLAPPAPSTMSQAEAAKRRGVSERLLREAKTVRDNGAPELWQAVREGKIKADAAAKAAVLPVDQQLKIIEVAESGKANAVRTVIKQGTRAQREAARGREIAALPQETFGVIVEDFEWDHETWSEAGRDRAAENHYAVARDAHSAEEIVARTAERFACAADNCVLFMWATIPHLAVALDVLRQRGFTYKSHYVWRKDRVITGYWCRARHELLLIGVKGKVDCPAPGTQWESVLDYPAGEHSAKPDAALRMIEGYYPSTPRLELNARRRRPGWQAWGNEVTPADPDIIALERAALARGLIDAEGTVRTSATSVVGFGYVTSDEWRALLAASESGVAPVASARSETAPADDGLGIPDYLRREEA